MKVIGIGTDIVELERIRELIDRGGDAFALRICTEKERQIAAQRRENATFYAGRWAAKEAAAKALGCGIGARCSFTDIEIINDVSGRPELRFYGNAAAYLAEIGGKEVSISISHERRYAVATVIITG